MAFKAAALKKLGNQFAKSECCNIIKLGKDEQLIDIHGNIISRVYL